MAVFEPQDYRRFIGGINLISGETNLRDYDLADAQNVDYDVDGSITQRLGIAHKAKANTFDTSLESYWLLDEATGLRYDQAQGQNHLIDADDVGQATAPTDWTGYAANFDGTADAYLSISNGVANLNGVGDFSVSFWFYMPEYLTAIDQMMFHCVDDPASVASGWRIRMNHTNNNLSFAVYSTTDGAWSQITTQASNLDNDKWHHCVCVKEDGIPGVLTIYIDSDKATKGETDNEQNTDTAAFTTGDLVVGARGTATVPDLLTVGRMDEVQYWAKALSDADVATLWATNVAGSVDDQSGNTVLADNGEDKGWVGLYNYKPRFGTDEIIGIVGGVFVRYDISVGSFVPVPFPSNWGGGYIDTNARFDFAQLWDRLYFGNGVDQNWRYEGSGQLFNMGVQPTGSNVVTGSTSDTGGEIEDTTFYYYYRLLPLRLDVGGRIVYGTPQDESAQFDHTGYTGNDGKNVLTIPTSDDPGQTHWGLYRLQTDDPANDRPLDGFNWIEDIETTIGSYDDIMSQADAGAQSETMSQYFGLGVPPPSQIFETTSINGSDQLLISGDPVNPQSLYISDLNTGPDTYFPADIQYVGRDSSDVITGIGKFFDNLIIFKTDRFFMAEPVFNVGIDDMAGTLVAGNFPWRIKLSNSDIGCESNWSIGNIENILIWKYERGIYVIRGVDAFGNVQVQKVSNKVAPLLNTVPGNSRNDQLGVVLKTPTRNHYRFFFGTGTTNNQCLIYDYDHITPDPEDQKPVGAFLPWTGFTAQVIASVENPSTNLDSVWFGDDDVHCWMMDSQDGFDEYIDADGAVAQRSITSLFKTRHLDHGVDHISKRWRMIVLEGITETGAINVAWSMDFGNSTAGVVSMNLNPAIESLAFFDVAKFDAAFFGGDAALISGRRRLYSATGHHMQLTFSQDALNSTWKIHGFVLYAITRPTVRVRKV